MVVCGRIFRYWRFGVREPDSAHLPAGRRSHRSKAAKRTSHPGRVFTRKSQAVREMNKQTRAYREDETEREAENQAWDKRADKVNGASLVQDLSEAELVQFAMMLSMEGNNSDVDAVAASASSSKEAQEDADLALAIYLAENPE